jgi:hypothetical protein
LLWTWALGWLLTVAFAAAWFYGFLPPRTGSTGAPTQAGSPYVHWWFDSSTASIRQCTNASLKIHTTGNAKPIEATDEDDQISGTTGVYGEIVTVIGCARIPSESVSFVLAAGPDQSDTKNKAALLRTLLTSELKANK